VITAMCDQQTLAGGTPVSVCRIRELERMARPKGVLHVMVILAECAVLQPNGNASQALDALAVATSSALTHTARHVCMLLYCVSCYRMSSPKHCTIRGWRHSCMRRSTAPGASSRCTHARALQAAVP
jgi:hypothetical protein